MTAIAPGDETHMRVWEVVSRAVHDPCRLTVGLQNIGIFVDRIRMRPADAPAIARAYTDEKGESTP